jgi:hypothetical protein
MEILSGNSIDPPATIYHISGKVEIDFGYHTAKAGPLCALPGGILFLGPSNYGWPSVGTQGITNDNASYH